MAKSKIIKELANGDISLKVALKRTKVLLSALEDERISNWVTNELVGYSASDQLPDYRVRSGQLMGSYFKGSMASHMKWNNVSIPLGNMPDDKRNDLLRMEFREGVEALSQLLDGSMQNEKVLGMQLPADIFPYLAACNDDPYMIITSAYIAVNPNCLQSILDEIEDRLLDTLLLLEGAFGNLDDLDIDLSKTDLIERKEVIEKIVVNIYNDHSITVGDRASIKDATIG